MVGRRPKAKSSFAFTDWKSWAKLRTAIKKQFLISKAVNDPLPWLVWRCAFCP
jgi:hypothetical protein